MSAGLEGRVVVGVDGSVEALAAVRWAATEAKRRAVPLHVVTAFHWTEAPVVGHPGLGPEFRDALLARAREHLRDAVTAATEREPGLDVEQQLASGHPTATLVAESHHAQLLVVGDRGLSRIVAALAGSVAVGVATHAACPVVVCRNSDVARPASAPVVVGVDATPASEAAIAFAFEAATARGAPLTAVHTWGDPLNDKRSAPLYDVLAGDADKLLGQCLAGWTEKFAGVDVERVVAHSKPAQELLTLSETAQLVVIGTRGHTELAGLVFGSVGNVLVHRAACPVAVVRPASPAGYRKSRT